MKSTQKKLARKQLDETMKRFKSLKTAAVPKKGWIRAIRDTLGMTGKQLAERMNVNQQRVARIEQDEKLGKVTLNTMRSAAQSLDCVFVYCVVPTNSLEQTVRNQAKSVAIKRMNRSNQMMRLEKQELIDNEKEKALEDLVDDVINEMPKSLWDEK